MSICEEKDTFLLKYVTQYLITQEAYNTDCFLIPMTILYLKGSPFKHTYMDCIHEVQHRK